MSQETAQELPPTKLTILISGNGSNLQAIIDATATVLRNVSIVRVISDRKNAYGLKRAEKAAIPTTYHNMLAGKYVAAKETDLEKKLQGRRAFDADLAEIVLKDGPDLVVCAGFMHILTPEFLTPLAGKDIPVINLHPALPGEYDGIRAIERAYEDYQNGKITRTGVMVHYVIQEVDAGTPLLTREVDFTKGEKLEDFEERLHKVEHTIIVEGTQKAMRELWESRAKKTAV